MYALTSIKGIGRRFANIVLRKAEVDLKKRYVLLRYPGPPPLGTLSVVWRRRASDPHAARSLPLELIPLIAFSL